MALHHSSDYQINWLFRLGEEVQNRFPKSHGGHLVHVFLIGTILVLFYLQVTLMIPTKFGVNWPFSSGEAKNRFSRWQPW